MPKSEQNPLVSQAFADAMKKRIDTPDPVASDTPDPVASDTPDPVASDTPDNLPHETPEYPTQVWAYNPSGNPYLVRLDDDNEIIAAFGPIFATAIEHYRTNDNDWDNHEPTRDWIMRNRDRFHSI